MSATFQTTIEREKRLLIGDGHTYEEVGVEVNVEVTYEYSKAQRERWGPSGGEPAEPEHCDILSARGHRHGQRIDAFRQRARSA